MHSFFVEAIIICAVATTALLAGCAPAPDPRRPISKEPFGATPDGRQVDLYTLRNAKGAEARITNYGGIVVSLRVPDRQGQLGDVLLGWLHFAAGWQARWRGASDEN